MLQDYEFFLHCDPHMAKYELVASDVEANIPDTLQSLGTTSSYKVTDVVNTLPAGLWDSNVISHYEFTNIENGVFVRIKSPLSIVMDTIWEIKKGAEDKLELVEDVSMYCSRLLVSVVKSQCENGWQKIHAKMLSRLKENAEGASSNGAAA